MQRITILVALFAMAEIATAQDDRQPIGTVKMIAGFAPGGAATTSCQILADAAGPSFVVVNMAGAGGKAAAEHVERYEGDDMLYCMASISTLKFPLDTALKPIGIFANYPAVLSVRADGPHDFASLMAAAREPNSKYNLVGTAGGGTVWHLIAADLYKRNNVAMLHSPYKTSADAILALHRGDIGAVLSSQHDYEVAKALGEAPERRLRIIATTGDEHIRIGGWMALLAPPKTSREKLEQYVGIFKTAVPKIRDRLAVFGFDAKWYPGSELLRRRIEAETLLIPLAKELNVKP